MNIHKPFELAVPVQAIDHWIGDAHAPVTLVEYGDFECPHCKQAAPLVKRLGERFASHIQIVFRHFPLEEVHSHALHAALAAEAAGGQGKFCPMHDVLFEHRLHLTLHQLRGYAESLELDMERYDADMEDDIYLQRVREQIDGGRLSGVRATPTFYINGKLQDVSYGLQSLLQGVEAALHK